MGLGAWVGDWAWFGNGAWFMLLIGVSNSSTANRLGMQVPLPTNPDFEEVLDQALHLFFNHRNPEYLAQCPLGTNPGCLELPNVTVEL